MYIYSILGIGHKRSIRFTINTTLLRRSISVQIQVGRVVVVDYEERELYVRVYRTVVLRGDKR